MTFGRKPEVQPPYNRCSRCRDTLDVNVSTHDRTMHEFCYWANGADFAALRHWFDGTLRGVDASGSY